MIRQLVLLLAGFAAVVAGVAWVFPPAGLIVAGVGVSVFALMWDFGGDRR